MTSPATASPDTEREPDLSESEDTPGPAAEPPTPEHEADAAATDDDDEAEELVDGPALGGRPGKGKKPKGMSLASKKKGVEVLLRVVMTKKEGPRESTKPITGTQEVKTERTNFELAEGSLTNLLNALVKDECALSASQLWTLVGDIIGKDDRRHWRRIGHGSTAGRMLFNVVFETRASLICTALRRLKAEERALLFPMLGLVLDFQNDEDEEAEVMVQAKAISLALDPFVSKWLVRPVPNSTASSSTSVPEGHPGAAAGGGSGNSSRSGSSSGAGSSAGGGTPATPPPPVRPHTFNYAQLHVPAVCAVLDALTTDASPLSGSKEGGVLLRKALEGVKENLVGQLPERPIEALPPAAVQLMELIKGTSVSNLKSSATGALLRDSLLRKRARDDADEAGET